MFLFLCVPAVVGPLPDLLFSVLLHRLALTPVTPSLLLS